MGDYLKTPRTSKDKPFSAENDALKGKSTFDSYQAYPDFKDVSDVHNKCVTYATAYTETMLTRAQVEDPEVFAMKGMNKSEMQQLLVHNMCLPYAKLRAKVFRDTTAKITEKHYLQDDIRRLYNKGDKFHPYM